MLYMWSLRHHSAFSGDLDRSRSTLGCAFCAGGDAGFDGGDAGPSWFSSAASALFMLVKVML